ELHQGWEARATTDADRIRKAWSTAPYNVGIACRPSGLLVVDLDVPKPETVRPPEWDLEGVVTGEDVLAVLAHPAGQPLPYATYPVLTPSGGRHLYFRQPEEPLGNTAGTLGWLVDTRGVGGYVVGAGSSVDGREYLEDLDQTPADLPDWLFQQLVP